MAKASSHTGLLEVLTRAFAILRKLQMAKYPVPVSELVEVTGRSRKQVKRYLEALEAAGIHLECDENGDFTRRISLAPESRRQLPLELIALTRDELIHVYLRLQGIPQAGDRKVADSLWAKIHTAMAGQVVSQKRLAGMLVNFDKAYKSYDSPERRAVLATLLDALYKQHSCQVTYRRPDGDGPATYKIEPYHLFAFDGGVYCYCRVPRFDEVRLLAVERIEALKLNEEPFERAPAVLAEIERKKTEAFRIMDDDDGPQTYRLRFPKEQAYYVKERVWHPTQQITDLPDGGIELTFTASGRFEIERWIRGWGEGVEVVRVGDG